MSSACKQFQEQIAGYIDRELELSQANTISQHLQNCSGCAEEAGAQQTMKELVMQHAPSVVSPTHLRAEIRRGLDREMVGFSFHRQLQQLFLRQPLPAFATVVMLMLLSGLATYFVFPKSQPEVSDTQFVAGNLEGEIICVDCDLLDLVKAAYVHDATHRLGLRCQDGHIWSILRSEKSTELSNNIHRRVRIVGQLFERMQYVEVREFSFI
jgi:mycothiol system anti-sigma-R factor